MEEKMLHTNLTEKDIAKYVFLPGSPQRCERIARCLENPIFIAVNREHETWSGYLEGERVLITSTGMGGPSTAIAVEELVHLGADTFIRVGSCASTCESVGKGDVVIPSACVRMEGTGLHYAPLEYPAIPDFEVFDSLREAGADMGFPVKIGTVISRDGFYTQYENNDKPNSFEITNKWKSYTMMGAIATEMEASALFLVSASLRVRAAAVMVCATNYRNTTADCTGNYPISYEPRAIEVAIEAMRNLIHKDRES